MEGLITVCCENHIVTHTVGTSGVVKWLKHAVHILTTVHYKVLNRMKHEVMISLGAGVLLQPMHDS
jgi:hypothetical protein